MHPYLIHPFFKNCNKIKEKKNPNPNPRRYIHESAVGFRFYGESRGSNFPVPWALALEI
jgi:hypothetical protein